MSDADTTVATPHQPERKRRDDRRAVLQVEKHDYVDLAPKHRERVQSMQGFDPEYTDIVDYIVRCTHRIWDEKNVGLIYTHYSHNAVVYGSLGTTHSREEVVRATIQRIAEYPERRGYASSVIWNGDDREGFYTSHLITSVGRHTVGGPYGAATGKTFYSRTIADCMIFQNKIYREWLVRDNMAQLLCLGVDVDALATRMAADQAARGVRAPVLGDGARILGQEQPVERPDTGIANSDAETELLLWMHEVWNLRMFGRLRDVYAPNVLWHGPSMRDLYGVSAVTHQVISLMAMMPDATWMAHHICSVESNEGGVKIALRWTMEGTHSGWGALGAPTGKPLFVMGMSHFHVVGGRVVEEWTIHDELALRVQFEAPRLTLRPMQTLACDFLIVGAGSAGCVLANRLSENPANRVLLVEAGGQDRDPLLHVPGAVSRTLATPRVNWGYQSEPEPGLAGRSVPLFRGRVLGGTSTLNGMIYTRGHARDYDYWRQDGCVGWSYEDVLPFFRKAERNERGADRFHGGDGPLEVTVGRPVTPICDAFLAAASAEGYPILNDFHGESQEGFGHYDVNIFRGRRWSTASAYLRPALKRRNLTLLTEAEVETLTFDGARVTGARVLRGGQSVLVQAARETLLAAGVFNSPKLLMLSGIGPGEALAALGIAVRGDRTGVGKNLQDHVSYRMNYACSLPITAYAYTRPLRGAKAVLDYALSRSGILANTSFPTGGFFRSHDGLEIPDMQVGLCMGLLPPPGKMLPEREGFTVTIRQGRPASRGEITLRSAAPADAPRIFPCYFSDPGDMPTLMRGIRRFRKLLQNEALARVIDHEIEPGQAVVDDDDALADSIRALSNTTHHFIGTCRMGGDEASVVDPQLRVRGFDGLRVIDASIMPSHINGNTNAPTIMIAEKGAAMVLAE